MIERFKSATVGNKLTHYHWAANDPHVLSEEANMVEKEEVELDPAQPFPDYVKDRSIFGGWRMWSMIYEILRPRPAPENVPLKGECLEHVHNDVHPETPDPVERYLGYPLEWEYKLATEPPIIPERDHLQEAIEGHTMALQEPVSFDICKYELPHLRLIIKKHFEPKGLNEFHQVL